MDASSSMAGEPTALMQHAASEFVDALYRPRRPRPIEVAVVEFNATSRVLSQLTADRNRIASAIHQVGASGGTRMDLGITSALDVLADGREASDLIDEEIILLSDGGNNSGCAPVLAAATQARGEGVDVVTVCMGTGCDGQCMRQIPGPDRAWRYFEAPEMTALPTVFAEIDRLLVDTEVDEVTLTETLGDLVEFVGGSADPWPSAPSEPDRWLVWRAHGVERDGITVTYAVRPLTAGTIALTRETRGDLVDHLGRTRSWLLDPASVTVLRSDAVPTATRDPAGPPTQTPKPLPTPIPTGPSPTPATGRGMAWLPWGKG